MATISTAFLHQDEYWGTEDGQKLRLDLMTQRHLSNVLAMLRRRAGALKFHEEVFLSFEAIGPLGPSGDGATWAFECAMSELECTPADEWLESTALVRRLRVLTGEESPNAHVPLSF